MVDGGRVERISEREERKSGSAFAAVRTRVGEICSITVIQSVQGQ